MWVLGNTAGIKRAGAVRPRLVLVTDSIETYARLWSARLRVAEAAATLERDLDPALLDGLGDAMRSGSFKPPRDPLLDPRVSDYLLAVADASKPRRGVPGNRASDTPPVLI